MGDYKYCNTDSCIHRRGCKRWLDNNFINDKKNIILIDTKKCIPNYMNTGCTNKFDYLDRIKYSAGKTVVKENV